MDLIRLIQDERNWLIVNGVMNRSVQETAGISWAYMRILDSEGLCFFVLVKP